MSTYDWTRFVRRIDVKAPTDTLYKAISTQEGLESWFLRLAEFTAPDKTVRKRDEAFKKGDGYRWMWHGWGDDTVETGTIVEVNGANEVKFTFAGSCVVTITIKTEGQDTVVELAQENIPADEKSKANRHLGCSVGWTFYLANLKAVFEHGVDLRNRNEALKRVVNS